MFPAALTVASVQLACELGDTDGNLKRATTLVEQAASQGATLVLLPELMPGGYTLTEKIWDAAEPFDGHLNPARKSKALAASKKARIGG